MKGYSDLNLRIEENMRYASDSNPCSSRCIRNNTKEIKAAVEDIGIEKRIVELQKTIILYSTMILQNVIEV